MRHLSLTAFLLLTLRFSLFTPSALHAGTPVSQKAYMFGFVACFTDSVVYFTDIQEVDSAWFDKKTHFLLGRNEYSYQLRDYFANDLKQPHRTCIVVFGQNRKQAEKKFLKMKRQYTTKNPGKYEVRNLNENQFHFKSVNMSEAEAQQPEPPKVKKRADKKNKSKARPPRNPDRKRGQ